MIKPFSEDLQKKLLHMAEQVKTQDNVSTALPITFGVQRPTAKYSRCTDDAEAYGNGYCAIIHDDTELYTLKEYIDHNGHLSTDTWIVDKVSCLDGVIDCEDSDVLWHFEELIREVSNGEALVMFRYYVDELYIDCGLFLTRESAQQFIDQNRHRVGDDAYVYTYHAWRNSDADVIQQMFDEINAGKE